MPVRSLNSCVLKWPDKTAVDQALRRWTYKAVQGHPEVQRLGLFGSYADGRWGVGSDIDLIAVVDETDVRFEQRIRSWDLSGLPVPADLVIYTEEEWTTMTAMEGRYGRMLRSGVVWLYQRVGHSPGETSPS